MIDLSLNEVESLALKAARGAGFAWGLAEEIAVSARALAVAGEPWDAALVALLDGEAAGHAPQSCPVRLGCQLLDRQSLPVPATPVSARLPIWLAPFARRLGHILGVALAVEVKVIPEAQWQAVEEPASGLDPARVLLVRVRASSAAPHPVATQTRAAYSPDMHARLSTYEARTYVPASEQSRLAGAGAGLSDND